MRRYWLLMLALLVALAAGSALLIPRLAPDDPMALSADGIGPLRLGEAFTRAEKASFRLMPDSAFSGIGCAGLEEIRYDGFLGQHPVGVMAMAEGNRIVEVEANLHEPMQADSLDACRALRDDFARPFIRRFGDFEKQWELPKPVSRELLATTGPVTLRARWFATGGSCYVSAHFKAEEHAGTRLAAEWAGLDPANADSSLN